MGSVMKASFVVANLTEKKKKSKAFTEGEFIRQCMESKADIMCPDFF